MDVLIKLTLIFWVSTLLFYSKKNINLKSLLIMMLIPKSIDLVVLTPLLEPLKTSDNYRQLFFIIHALNDLLMLLLIRYRFLISSLMQTKTIYREMEIEKIICLLFLISIYLNISVFGDFYRFWEYNFNMPRSYFYYKQQFVQYFLIVLESAILGFLTIKTIIAIKQLKQKGLID